MPNATRSSRAKGATPSRATDPLDVEIRELRSEVARLRTYVETIDGDMAAMEDAIEFFQRQNSKYLWILGDVVRILGRLTGDRNGWFDKHHRSLYPNDSAGMPNAAADMLSWNRPRRRWATFGTAGEVRALAREKGIKVRAGEGREWVIRHMWKAGVLPKFSERELRVRRATED